MAEKKLYFCDFSGGGGGGSGPPVPPSGSAHGILFCLTFFVCEQQRL